MVALECGEAEIEAASQVQRPNHCATETHSCIKGGRKSKRLTTYQ